MIRYLFHPIDNSPLIVFRIALGFIFLAESAGAILTGWVHETFIEPEFTFTFIGFEWLRVFNGPLMYGWYALMAVLAIGVILGWRYKFCMTALALLWTGCYLMQKSHYNNHYYLMMLLSYMMIFVPAHRYRAVDVKRNPALMRLTCPRWCVLMFVALIGVVYFYAATAKMQPDWLEGRPLSLWFSRKTHYFLVGPLLAQPWIPIVVAYAGMCFDLLVVPLLLWRKTRWLAVGASVFFHLFNSAVFHIGTFPYMMIGSLVLFFPPEQVRKHFFPNKPSQDQVQVQAQPPVQKWVLLALGCFFLVQITLPVRHHFFEGYVQWTEEGHRLSWRMMLRAKQGNCVFTIQDPSTGDSWQIRPNKQLPPHQARRLSTHPDMIWQYVQVLKAQYAAEGKPDVKIFARVRVSLNGHPYQPLIDPKVDLAKVPWEHFRHHGWISLREKQ